MDWSRIETRGVREIFLRDKSLIGDTSRGPAVQAGRSVQMSGARVSVQLRRTAGRLLTGVIGPGVLALAVAGCRTTTDAAPGPARELSCADPGTTSLGVPTVRHPARLTTSGGLHRFVVEALPTGSIFGEIEDTEVQLSEPNAPAEVRFRVTASRQKPGVIEVEAGTYIVLNTDRGGIEVEVCRDVTLSDVEAATPAPGID